MNMDKQKTLNLYMDYIQAFENKDYDSIAMYVGRRSLPRHLQEPQFLGIERSSWKASPY